MSRYAITTTIRGESVAVECDEKTARILLPLWAADEPNLTECRNRTTGEIVACFLDRAAWPAARLAPN